MLSLRLCLLFPLLISGLTSCCLFHFQVIQHFLLFFDQHFDPNLNFGFWILFLFWDFFSTFFFLLMFFILRLSLLGFQLLFDRDYGYFSSSLEIVKHSKVPLPLGEELSAFLFIPTFLWLLLISTLLLFLFLPPRFPLWVLVGFQTEANFSHHYCPPKQ